MSESDKWSLIQYAAAVRRTVEAVRHVRQYDIEPIVIKGIAAARFYDDPTRRRSTDVDLVVAAEDRLSIERLFDEKEIRRRQIDWHFGLRRLDLQPFENFRQNTSQIILEDTPITVPGEEDHLRIICAHWLLDGGLFYEKLWDVYYLVKNRSETFDWDLCLADDISASWVKFVIACCAKYQRLSLDNIPFRNETSAENYLSKNYLKILENRWKNPYRLVELNSIRQDRKQFWQQIGLRLKPDPFKAAVNTSSKLKSEISYSLIIKDLWLRFILCRKNLQ